MNVTPLGIGPQRRWPVVRVPGMYGIFTVEAVRQLRGGLGERQVGGAHVALAHGNGGVLSAQATALFGTADTL